jgi:hypothetical protein
MDHNHLKLRVSKIHNSGIRQTWLRLTTAYNRIKVNAVLMYTGVRYWRVT